MRNNVFFESVVLFAIGCIVGWLYAINATLNQILEILRATT